MDTSPSTIDWTQRYRVPHEVLVRRVDDVAVLLKLQTHETFSLDEVGTRVFEAVASSDSLQSALEIVRAEYDVEFERLRTDVWELVSEFVERGLMERRST